MEEWAMALLILNVDQDGQNIQAQTIVNARLSDCFRCYTEKALMEKWWSGPGYKNKVLKFHPESGGSFHYLNFNYEGAELYFRGVFHLIEPDHLIIQTFEAEHPGAEPIVSLEKILFEKVDDHTTRITNLSTYQSKELLKAVVPDDMYQGLSQTMNQLEECAASLA